MTTITRYTKGFVHYLRNNRAVSALEYAILIGIIAVAVASAITALSGGIEGGIDAAKVKVDAAVALIENGSDDD